MRVAILGRSQLLLRSAIRLLREGHEIGFVATSRGENYYTVGEKDFKDFSDKVGAQFHIGTKLDSPDVLERIRDSRCDVAVSLNWKNVLGDLVCGSFQHGIFNIHAGDLPRYRGNAAVNWAILQGEPILGLCLHRMVPYELDSGPILAREELALDQDTYVGDVYEWLELTVPGLVVYGLRMLASGTAVLVEQSKDPADALRCYPRRPEDARIDWGRSALDVRRLVRASSAPFEGAFCYLNGDNKIRVWRAEVADHPSPFLAVPGQVLFRAEGDPIIACGEGALRITQASLDDDTDARQAVGQSLRNRLT